MKQYLFELHAHTSDISRCGQIPAEKLVELYESAGYSGMVITDHINRMTFQNLELATWKDKVDYFLRGYHTAKSVASSDFTVLLGAEFCFTENYNDYLVYGLTEDLMYNALDNEILQWGIGRFSAFCRDNDLLIIQAHPFRNYMFITPPKLIDGVEVMNCHPRHDSRNFLAQSWAEHFGLLKISGSDAHQPQDVGRGGILTQQPISSLSELINEIRNCAELIIPEDMQ